MPELWQKVKEEYLSEVNPPWLDKDKLIKSMTSNKHETTPQIWRIINFLFGPKQILLLRILPTPRRGDHC